jgi:hypothetical protein
MFALRFFLGFCCIKSFLVFKDFACGFVAVVRFAINE